MPSVKKPWTAARLAKVQEKKSCNNQEHGEAVPRHYAFNLNQLNCCFANVLGMSWQTRRKIDIYNFDCFDGCFPVSG